MDVGIFGSISSDRMRYVYPNHDEAPMTWDLSIEQGNGLWHLMGEMHSGNKLFSKMVLFSSKNREDVAVLFTVLYKSMMILEEGKGVAGVQG